METEDLVRIRETFAHLVKDSRGAALLETLSENGWQDILQEDPELSIAGMFYEFGRALSASPVLDSVILSTINLPDNSCAIIYPELSAESLSAGRLDESGVLSVRGVCLSGLERASTAIVAVMPAGGELQAYRITAANELTRELVESLDPELGLIRVTGEFSSKGIELLETTNWQLALNLARIALAYELVGMAGKMLEMAVEQVTNRKQFGRPIGSFQTVKHRLAEIYVEISSSHLVLETAFKDKSDLTAMVAKAQAGAAALMATTHVQQVCGGMGWTWEYGLHAYIRRAFMLDALLGTSSNLQKQLGRHFLETGVVPRIDDMVDEAGESHE